MATNCAANHAEYWTGDEISREYAVGTQRLLAFAMRGNLAMRVEEGEQFFDLEMVKKLFRRRDAAEEQGMTLGCGFRLGDSLGGAAVATVASALPQPGRSRRYSERVARPVTLEPGAREHKTNAA